MERKEVVGLVLMRLREITSEISKQKQIEMPAILDESTRLIGKKAVLDSLGLVNLIISVEQEINDTNGVPITIADERAMSMEKSPFKSVGTLVDYICFLIDEQTQPVSSTATSG
jgi:acyl carrier protein